MKLSLDEGLTRYVIRKALMDLDARVKSIESAIHRVEDMIMTDDGAIPLRIYHQMQQLDGQCG